VLTKNESEKTTYPDPKPRKPHILIPSQKTTYPDPICIIYPNAIKMGRIKSRRARNIQCKAQRTAGADPTKGHVYAHRTADADQS
jgi:hypothetical protein